MCFNRDLSTSLFKLTNYRKFYFCKVWEAYCGLPIYYAITIAAALFIPDKEQLFPRWIPVLGLLSCLVLAAFIETRILLTGPGIIVAGIA
jgi:hypothetical protein